jgi:ribonuclease R
MLLEKLSNDLCSLNPHTDKLTITCEMKIAKKTAQIITSKVYKSLIKSDFRLTYKDVDEIRGKLKVENEKESTYF